MNWEPWTGCYRISDAGMAVALLLFFAIDPIYSIVLGIFAGKHMKEIQER